MPSPLLEERLNACDAKLDALFEGIELNPKIQGQLKGLKEYYRNLYMDGPDDKEEVYIKMYELFAKGLEGVKKGEIKSEEVLKDFKELKSIRKTRIIAENILNTLELLFWATSASVFFTACVAFSSPLIVANPFLALAAITTACIWAIHSIESFFECIDDFKSLTPVEEEYKREKDLISFFKAPVSSSPVPLSPKVSVKEKEKDGLYPDVHTLGQMSC